MSGRSIALVEVKLETPTIITRKLGKGGFYSSAHVIPSTTLLGALARAAVVDNVRAQRGNCAELRTPSDKLDCPNCPIASECAYTALWQKQQVNLSDALPAPDEQSPVLGTPSTLLNLQSIFESKRTRDLADGLLYIAAQKMAVRGMVPKEVLTRILKVKQAFAKKRAKTVWFTKAEGDIIGIKSCEPRGHVETHVSINPRYRSAERGLLFSFRVLAEGTRFYAPVLGDADFLKQWFTDRSVLIGAGRSRGYGQAKVQLLEPQPVDTYVKTRTRDILQGFQLITEQLSQHDVKVETTLGTITGLSPLSLAGNGQVRSPVKALSQRLDLAPDQLIALLTRRGVRPRWDRDTFINTYAVNPGYCVVFQATEDTNTLAEKLARAEVDWQSKIPGYGWLCINHPVHSCSQSSW